jgi:hypothetical protein
MASARKTTAALPPFLADETDTPTPYFLLNYAFPVPGAEIAAQPLLNRALFLLGPPA